MGQGIVEFEEVGGDVGTERHVVIIYNNDYNSVQQVVNVLISATQCSVEEAAIETWEAHHYGHALVHFASESECHTVARSISRIGVVTKVQPEWNEVPQFRS